MQCHKSAIVKANKTMRKNISSTTQCVALTTIWRMHQVWLEKLPLPETGMQQPGGALGPLHLRMLKAVQGRTSVAETASFLTKITDGEEKIGMSEHVGYFKFYTVLCLTGQHSHYYNST